jgi:S1-C subfamily serine protease
MQAIDVVLVLLALVFAVNGYREGFISGALYFVGLALGALAGMRVAPVIAHRFANGTAQAKVGIVVVLVAAIIGQLVGTSIGHALRSRLRWKPVQRLDAVGGALTSAAGLLVISWLIATEIKDSPFADISRQVSGSRVLRAVEAVMPPAPEITAPFRRLISREDFPQVFADIRGGRARSVPAPDQAVLRSRAVTSSRDSVVRITGTARACDRRSEGTGFVYAREYVMTNAHVVAGVRDARVEGDGGSPRAARVVLFDPQRDVAVLHVPGLDLAPLDFAGTANSGDSAVVAGYPEDGPFTAVAARVRDEIVAVGRDIYERGSVRRKVYSLRAKVRPGNSGGPLLSTDGDVYGVVFAAAADDPDTGYALTAGEVQPSATSARTLTATVGTGDCR